MKTAALLVFALMLSSCRVFQSPFSSSEPKRRPLVEASGRSDCRTMTGEYYRILDERNALYQKMVYARSGFFRPSERDMDEMAAMMDTLNDEAMTFETEILPLSCDNSTSRR